MKRKNERMKADPSRRRLRKTSPPISLFTIKGEKRRTLPKSKSGERGVRMGEGAMALRNQSRRMRPLRRRERANSKRAKKEKYVPRCRGKKGERTR